MRIRLILFLLLFLSIIKDASAQNHLVTHRFIYDKVALNFFQQRPGTTIPQDDYCITKAEAMSWLVLDESRLPTDARLPWWSEIIPVTEYLPCVGTNFNVCQVSNPAYNSCGSWLYALGFSPYMSSYSRTRLGATNPLWNATSSHQSTYCGYTPTGTKTSLMGFAPMNAPAAGTVQDSTMMNNSMVSPMAVYDLGPMNRSAIWSCTNVGSQQWLYANATFIATEAKQYLVGIGADNHFRVYIDGTLIVANEITDSENFKLWHIFPVNLAAGQHTIRLEGRDDGVAGAIACEIYDNTPAGLASAIMDSDMKIIFSTKDIPNSRICVDAPPPEYLLTVINNSNASEINSVSGTNGWQLGNTLYAGLSDMGNFSAHYGSLSVTVSAFEWCSIILYANGYEVRREDVQWGYNQSIYLDVSMHTNVNLTVELITR